jgi:UDPglucose--hexose-1-phosphate uridylyltransferase
MSLVRDPISGEWSLRAPVRRTRPNEFANAPGMRCAFCPGSEDLTTEEIARTPDANGAWVVRVFANKYPAIAAGGGVHEVIVDAPDHSHEFTREGIDMWRIRYRVALTSMPGSFPVIFKNRGEYAGATQRHPHTQLLALPQRPVRWAGMERNARAYREAHDRCIWCDEATRGEAGPLNVVSSGELRAYVRAESRIGGTLTIVPRECAGSPDVASDEAWNGIASFLERLGSRLDAEFGEGAAFNTVLNADPHAGAFHWHLEVAIRRSLVAGFELATGIFVDDGSAEESAEHWRRMLALPDGPI